MVALQSTLEVDSKIAESMSQMSITTLSYESLHDEKQKVKKSVSPKRGEPGLSKILTSPIQLKHENNIANKRARTEFSTSMNSGLALPLMEDDQWLGGGTDQQPVRRRTVSDFSELGSDIMSPPESPLADSENVQMVFRRIGEAEDKFQRTPKLKNSGLVISTSFQEDEEDTVEETVDEPKQLCPLTPKNRRTFKTFWDFHFPGLSSPIVTSKNNLNNIIHPMESFSIGTVNEAYKPEHQSSVMPSWFRQNQARAHRLSICRRLKNVIPVTDGTITSPSGQLSLPALPSYEQEDILPRNLSCNSDGVEQFSHRPNKALLRARLRRRKHESRRRNKSRRASFQDAPRWNPPSHSFHFATL